MRIFEAADGQKITFLSRSVGVVTGAEAVSVDREIECEAVATDEFRRIGGILRRRFVHCVPQIVAGDDDVWLADEELDPAKVVKGDSGE